MATIDNVLHGLHCTGVWLTDGPKRVFNNVGAMSDALKLTQRVSEIAKAILSFNPIENVTKMLGHVCEFIGARNIVGRVADLVSFKDAWANPLCGGVNFFWVGNKVSSLIGDISSTVKWLASIDVFGSALSSQIRNTTGQFLSWGNPFNILKGIGDFSCVTSSLFDLADIARQAIHEMFDGGKYMVDGQFKAKTAGSHVFGTVWNIAKIAGCVLSNIPGVQMVYCAVAGTVGAVTSLGKFYVKEYLKDPEGPNGRDLPPEAEAPLAEAEVEAPLAEAEAEVEAEAPLAEAEAEAEAEVEAPLAEAEAEVEAPLAEAEAEAEVEAPLAEAEPRLVAGQEQISEVQHTEAMAV